MLGRLRNFLALSSSDRRIFIKAYLMLYAVRWTLVFLPFKWVRRILGKWTKPRPMSSPQDVQVRRIIWAIDLATHHQQKLKTCLMRAIAAQILLARIGCPSDLKIGVTRDGDGKFKAHAWLEQDAKVLIGNLPDLHGYTVMPL